MREWFSWFLGGGPGVSGFLRFSVSIYCSVFRSGQRSLSGEINLDEIGTTSILLGSTFLSTGVDSEAWKFGIIRLKNRGTLPDGGAQIIVVGFVPPKTEIQQGRCVVSPFSTESACSALVGIQSPSLHSPSSCSTRTTVIESGVDPMAAG